MYCLRVFIVVLQELFTTVFTLIGHCVSELGHLSSYRNVWPEAVYCCFKRTTLFTEVFTYLYDQS